jgi:hypothetical protein
MITNFKIKPGRSRKFMDWIITQPCCLTGHRATEYLGVDPHHQNRPGESGTSTKPCDSRCVPIRHDLHVEMESPGHSRREVWERFNKDPENIIEQMKAKFLSEGGKKFWQ